MHSGQCSDAPGSYMALLRLHREVLRTQGSPDNATYLSLMPSMRGTLRVSFHLILQQTTGSNIIIMLYTA